jgi:glucose/mannose-6-phosphate isomerase
MIPLFDAIKSFPGQFEFKPIVENSDKLKSASSFIVAGMGGSHLAADLLLVWNSSLNLIVHSDYGLPELSDKVLKNTLVIISSYSGNTEETIDAFHSALSKKIPTAIISAGGRLIESAKEHNIPYIQLPDKGIQPRSALGLSTVALLKIMKKEEALREIRKLTHLLDVGKTEDEGKKIASKIHGFIPIVYSSARNKPIAHNWKINFNETAKIPAFYNVFPELNHNEMVSFAYKGKAEELSKYFYFIFLSDANDYSRIRLRMEILNEEYCKRGFPVETCELYGRTVWEKIFSSLLLSNWISYYIATLYGFDPEEVKFVEEFKRLMAEKGNKIKNEKFRIKKG